MADFVVEALDTVTLDFSGAQGAAADGLLAGHDLMSPYVWRDGDRGLRLLVRVLANPLGPDDPTGLIYAGTSDDGARWTIDPKAVIAPGPDFVDAGGVEDPTVVTGENGNLLIYYTGVDGRREQGSLLVARGPALDRLEKQRVALKAPEGEGNIKEATVARGQDGRYRLFYEYARDNASRIGLAVGDTPDGPWTVVDDPFDIRTESWDNWHLSTGPILSRPGQDPVMFYNGATADARWRIGWVTFDADFTRVTDRCVEPMLVPPPPEHRDGTDIAFAASCVETGKEGEVHLYLSVEDRLLRRATVRCYG
jgi:predicted GH43/DUF377 family glycosyl hydrolase